MGKKKISQVALLSCLIFISIDIQAQSSYGSQYNTKYNPLSGNWIGWDIGNNKRDYDVKIPVREQVGGLRFSNDYSTIRVPSKSSSASTNRRKKYVSPSDVNARIEEWRQVQFERAEAKRIRREMENASDRAHGYEEYQMRTRGFHEENAARDVWMISEGVRYLQENFRVDHMANIPDENDTKPNVNTMSGREMSKLLKIDNGLDITIVFERNQVVEKSIDSISGEIPISSDLYIDEDQTDEYASSFEKPSILTILESNESKVAEAIILVNNQELPMDSLDIFVLPRYGLVAVWGDSLIVLKDNDMGAIAWLDGGIYSAVVPCGDKLIGKCKNSLYLIGEQEPSLLMNFDTNDFYVYPNNETSVLLLFRHEGISIIIKVDIEHRTYKELVRIPHSIWSIASNGNTTFALIDNTVFAIANNGSPTKFFEVEECINDIVICSGGLLIATDKRIILVGSFHNADIFYDKGVKKLWFDGQNVYAQNRGNDLLIFK